VIKFKTLNLLVRGRIPRMRPFIIC